MFLMQLQAGKTHTLPPIFKPSKRFKPARSSKIASPFFNAFLITGAFVTLFALQQLFHPPKLSAQENSGNRPTPTLDSTLTFPSYSSSLQTAITGEILHIKTPFLSDSVSIGSFLLQAGDLSSTIRTNLSGRGGGVYYVFEKGVLSIFPGRFNDAEVEISPVLSLDGKPFFLYENMPYLAPNGSLLCVSPGGMIVFLPGKTLKVLLQKLVPGAKPLRKPSISVVPPEDYEGEKGSEDAVPGSKVYLDDETMGSNHLRISTDCNPFINKAKSR